jgi:hypothetical protein
MSWCLPGLLAEHLHEEILVLESRTNDSRRFKLVSHIGEMDIQSPEAALEHSRVMLGAELDIMLKLERCRFLPLQQ